MKILVTGGAGFIGSHITDNLVDMGHTVHIADDLSTGHERNINKKAKFHKIDVSNSKKIEGLFEKFKYDIVFHAAAQIDVRKASQDPQRDAEINIIGTINLLKSAVNNNARKIVFSSTGGAMYGNVEEPADENTPADPKSHYGISKYSDEMYIYFFGEEHGLEYTILRYANVYGPRQSAKGEAGVISIFIDNMKADRECILYGFGNMMRDYIYVDDIVEANILSMTKGKKSIYNVGTGVKTSVKTLYDKLKSYFPEYNKETVKKDRRAGELMSSVLDSGKLLQDYDIDKFTALDTGLEQTVKWFKDKDNE